MEVDDHAHLHAGEAQPGLHELALLEADLVHGENADEERSCDDEVHLRGGFDLPSAVVEVQRTATLGGHLHVPEFDGEAFLINLA